MAHAISVTPQHARAPLKELLIARYAQLGRQLERFVGSTDDAADALQETWLHLQGMPEPRFVNGEAYLLRMASNLVVDQYRREKRRLRDAPPDDFVEIVDELADPERIVAARRKLETLKQVVRRLPPRQQEILRAARIEGELNREIAVRLGISQRLVESELSRALKYCDQCMREGVAAGGTRGRGRRKY